MVLTYEDIFRETDDEKTVRIILSVLWFLGLRGKEEDKKFANPTVTTGDQRTRNEYGWLVGVDALGE